MRRELHLALLALVAAREQSLLRAKTELHTEQRLTEHHAQEERLHHMQLPAVPQPRAAAAKALSVGSLLEATYRSLTEQLMNASVVPMQEQFCPYFSFEADVNGACPNGWNCSGAAQVRHQTCIQPMGS